MDIAASLGYTGQEVLFVDSERFAFLTGNSICITDFIKGPREMVWKDECGIGKFCVNLDTECIAIAPALSDADIEIIKMPGQAIACRLPSPALSVIISMCFSRKGDRLMALSDIQDHRISAWTIVDDESELIFSLQLDAVFKCCSVNPGDENYFCLFGDEGLVIGTAVDVLGKYSAKIHAIENSAGETLSFKVQFAIWLPLNRLLVGDGFGNVFLVNCVEKKYHWLGKLSLANALRKAPNDKLQSQFVPVSAILTVHSLVVGSDSGYICWFPVVDIMSTAPDAQIIDFNSCQQVASINRPISNFSADQNLVTLLVTTFTGEIFKVALDLALEAADDLNKAENENNEFNTGQAVNGAESIQDIDPEKFTCTDWQNGIVLSSTHVAFGVAKPIGFGGGTSKSTLTLMVTGSHTGSLVFWRQPAILVEPMLPGAGIRRSAPRTMKEVFSLKTLPKPIPSVPNGQGVSSLESSESAAITSMQFISIPLFSNTKLLFVGTNTGWLEVWLVEVTEQMDDIEENDATSPLLPPELAAKHPEILPKGGHVEMRLVEDDEGVSIVRIEARKLYENRFFESALSFITPFTTKVASNHSTVESSKSKLKGNRGAVGATSNLDKNSCDEDYSTRHMLALSSSSDSRVYFFNVLNDADVILQCHDNNLFIGEKIHLRAVFCIDQTLFFFNQNGSMLTFDTFNCDHSDSDHKHKNDDSWSEKLQHHAHCGDSSLHSVNAATIIRQSPPTAFIASGSGSILHSVPLSHALNNSAVKSEMKSFDCNELSICVVISPSGQYLASGGIDGSVDIWKVEEQDDPASPILTFSANRLCLHGGPVVSLTFSADSSMLLSGGVDGSCFISTVDKPSSIDNSIVTGTADSNTTTSAQGLSKKKPLGNLLAVTGEEEEEEGDEDDEKVLDSKSVSIINRLIVAQTSSNTNNDMGSSLEDPEYGMSNALNNENHQLTWLQKKEKESVRIVRAQQRFKAMGVSAAVNEIGHRLAVLLGQNEEREAIEQLDRSEFVIDVTRKEALLQANADAVSTKKKNYLMRNAWNELLAARMKIKCWDSMSEDARAMDLLPFAVSGSRSPRTPTTVDTKTQGSVSSFPILKWTEKQRACIDKVKRLRALEIKTQRMHSSVLTQHSSGLSVIHRIASSDHNEESIPASLSGAQVYRCGWNSSLHGCPVDTSWIFNDGCRWPNTSDLMDNLTTNGTVDGTRNAGSSAGAVPVSTEVSAGGTNVPASKDAVIAVSRDLPTKRSMGSIDGLENSDAPLSDAALQAQSYDEDMANSADFDDTNVLNLLYAPQSIRTQIQKRTQILLLKEVVQLIRLKFNERFHMLRREKEDILASINSRNARIDTIMKDLHLESGVPVSNLIFSDEELPDTTVKVKNSELEAKPYESEIARQQRMKAEEERIRLEQENNKEDIRKRALEEMMNGTLEVKRDAFADATSLLAKPDWMVAMEGPDSSTPLLLAELNESQLKELEAYQQKVKALQEEQANYRKALEQEAKKLRNEIADVSKAFDEKLEDLARLKVLVLREILSHEMYMARLAFNMAKMDQARKNVKLYEHQIASSKKGRDELRAKIDAFNVKLDEMRNKINGIQDEERQMDKTFKRDLQTLCNNTFDQESLKIFTQLYRIRNYPAGHYQHGNGVDADLTGAYSGSESHMMDDTNGGDNSHTGDRTGSNSFSHAGGRSKTGNFKSSSKRGGGSHKAGQSKKHGHNASRSTTHRGTKKGGNNAASMMSSARGGGSGMVSHQGGGHGGVSESGGGRDNSHLGPMQQAAMAMRTSELDALGGGKGYMKDRDPFYPALLQKERKKNAIDSQLPIPSMLSMELDCPEGFVVDQFYWSKLQELRSARIDKEIEGKLLGIEFNELKQKLDVFDKEEQVLADSVKNLRDRRDALEAKLVDLASNLDLIVSLRQGQNEVDRDAVVTDYSKSLLLPTDVIAKFNSRIRDLGREKIGVLSRIKQFRRKINLVDWDAQRLRLEARHLEAYLTDLQLFRVTRELQKIIRDGSNANQAKDKLEKVTQRKDFMNRDAETKIFQLKKANELLIRQIEDRTAECVTLEDRVEALQGQVQSCQSVKQSRDEARVGGDASASAYASDAIGLAAAKMKKVVTRRHMVDTARAQAEEIDFLRQELDKMRQRTFPSFVRATKKRIPTKQQIL